MSQDFSVFLRKRLKQQAVQEGEYSSDMIELKPGERRDVAVLFLDLGGFTALSERLDHEAVHEISRGVMDALVDITENYGGYVDKIEGDRIMVLFGARRAGENDSERAVSCGLLMLSAIRTANDILADTGVPITARIGINSGPVTVAPDAIGHLTAIGRTVNLASRMEEAADENTILVPDTVREKCREHFRWEDTGPVTLKGISHPVPSFRPVEQAAVCSPRWERLSSAGTAGFVGREKELAFLRELLGRQRSRTTGAGRLGGQKHLVAEVMGEAGIGKSRLVNEFLRDSCGGDTRMMILQGQTKSYAQPAYYLWVSVLRDLLHLDPGYRPSYREFSRSVLEIAEGEDVRGSLPFLAELLSIKSGDRRLDELDSGAIALETRIAFRNLLKALSAGSQLVVVMDDLHWIDSTCRGVLEFITCNCPSGDPILFILISRYERDDGRPVEFDIKPGYAIRQQLSVPAMGEGDSRGIINAILSGTGGGDPAPVSERTEGFLMRHSQGNPFFLEELVLDLVESGLLEIREGEWVFTRSIDEIYVPSSLTGLLQSRLDRLSDQHRGSLQKSSVLGFEFRLMLYERLLDRLDLREDTEAVFCSLERRQFLVGKETSREKIYEFRHILVHDTVYSTILESNRRLLHRLTARILEESSNDGEREMADILAHHWERAGDREKAIQWGIISLNHMVTTYQHERALELSGKLGSWIREKPLNSDGVGRLLEVMMGRCSTLDMLGRRREQEELLLSMKDLAEGFRERKWQARIQSSLGSIFRITGRMQEAEKCYRSALDLAREEDSEVHQSRVLCNLGILSRVRGDLEEAGSFFLQALEKNRGAGDPRVECVILGNLGNLYFDQGLHNEAIDYYEQAMELTREVGDRRSEGIALGNLGNPYMSKGDLEKALEYYSLSLALHREIGNRRSEGVTLSNLGALYCDHQRYDESRDFNEKALEIHRETGNRMMEAITFASLALLRIRSSDGQGALDYYRGALAIIEEHGLSASGFDRFEELRGRLLSAGFTADQVPRPSEWTDD